MGSFKKKEHSWTSMQVVTLGATRPIEGIDAIEWSEDPNAEYHFGAGRDPVSYTVGQRGYSASITLHKSEYDAILKANKGKKVSDLAPFDINISFSDDLINIIKVTLNGCLVSGTVTESITKEGGLVTVQLPLICADITTIVP